MVLARPSESVTPAVNSTDPPAVTAANVTGTPRTGRLSAARTSTTKGVISVWLAVSLCRSPEILSNWVGTGMNVTRVESAFPLGVQACTITLLRLFGAMRRPSDRIDTPGVEVNHRR